MPDMLKQGPGIRYETAYKEAETLWCMKMVLKENWQGKCSMIMHDLIEFSRKEGCCMHMNTYIIISVTIMQ